MNSQSGIGYNLQHSSSLIAQYGIGNNLQHLSIKSIGWSVWVLGVTLEYLKLQANSRRKSKQAKGTRNMNKINSKLSDNKNDART